MPVEFDILNKTAAQSAEFSRRFNDLPTELQIMIIAETVRFRGSVPLQHHRRVLRHDPLRFAEDNTLAEEACEQLSKVNGFLFWMHKSLELDRTAFLILDLNLILTISVRGGDVSDESTYMLPLDVVDYMKNISRVSRFLRACS